MRYRKIKYKYTSVDLEKTQTEIRINIDTDYVKIRHGTLVVMAKYAWDGGSGIAINTKNSRLGTLFHDALYQLMRENLLLRSYKNSADLLMKRVLISEGMSKFRAHLWYLVVKMLGKKHTFPRKYPSGQIMET